MHQENPNSTPNSMPNASSQLNDENDNSSVTSREITSQFLDNTEENKSKLNNTSHTNENSITTVGQSIPLNTVSRFITQSTSNQHLISYNNLPSPTSLIIQTSQPQTLFLQALAKLNESSLSLAINKDEFNMPLNRGPHSIQEIPKVFEPSELLPPDSLTSAPPSYSFVLRQMAARRPRLMGTFIPSPSFKMHTPPPNYATAFDIYVDNSIPPAPIRVHTFGFTPTLIICPECGFTGMTVVATKITLSTHLCAMLLCLICCWVCAPLPYVLRSCKNVYHYCRNCRYYLGMYCPSNPENVQST